MEEDFDIYADLPSIRAEENENEEQRENNNKLQENNQNLEKEVGDLKSKVESLEGLYGKLTINFSSLIKTAKAEITRKDRTISDLRAKLDNVMFRRNQRNRKVDQNNANPPNPLSTKEIVTNGIPCVQQIINHQFSYPPPPINTAFAQYGQMNNHQFSYLPPPISSVPNGDEIVQEEYIIPEEDTNSGDRESDDGVTNKSEYRSTVYGERLRKKLIDEQENEKRKKEADLQNSKKLLDEQENNRIKKEPELQDREKLLVDQDNDTIKKEVEMQNNKKLLDELENDKRKREAELKILEENEVRQQEEIKQKSKFVDQLNNKENLSLANKPVLKLDDNLNSIKSLDHVQNSAGFEDQIEFTQSKEDTYRNKKDDISKTDKYMDSSSSGSHISNKNYVNNYRNKSSHYDPLIHKNPRNRDSNNRDRHKYNDLHNTESSHRHSRHDRYIHQSERHDRHKSAHRHKSLDVERSKSNHRCKKDTTKKLDDRQNYTPEKIKRHKKDKKYREEFETLEKDKKRRNKIKTPKRKRRSKSKEKASPKTKRRKTKIEDITEVLSNEISVDATKIHTSKPIDDIQENGRKIINDIIDKKETSLKYTKEVIESNKVIVEPKISTSKESIREKNKNKVKYNNEKTTNNVENIIETINSNKNKVDIKSSCILPPKENVFKKETKEIEDNSKKMVNDIITIEKLQAGNTKCLKELEEGEIVDSPYFELQDDSMDVENTENTIKTEKLVELVIENESRIQEGEKTSEKLFDQQIKRVKLTKTGNRDKEVCKTVRKEKEQTFKHKKPKNQDEKVESKILSSSIAEKDSKRHHDSSTSLKKRKENMSDNQALTETKMLHNDSSITLNKMERNILGNSALDTRKELHHNPSISSENIKESTLGKSTFEVTKQLHHEPSITPEKMKESTLEKPTLDVTKQLHRDNNIIHEQIKESTLEKVLEVKKQVHGDTSISHDMLQIEENTLEKPTLKVKKQLDNDTSTNKNIKETTIEKPTLYTTNSKEEKNNNDKINKVPSVNVEVEAQNNKPCINKNIVENKSNNTKKGKNSKLKTNQIVVENTCTEINQNTKDDTLLKKENKQASVNNKISNKPPFKPLVDSEIQINSKGVNNLNEIKTNVLKPKVGRNIIIVKRRKRPVQLSDSPPVLVINHTDLNKAK